MLTCGSPEPSFMDGEKFNPTDAYMDSNTEKNTSKENMSP